MPIGQSASYVSLNLREVTALWRFNTRSDDTLHVVVLQRCQSESGMKNFAIEDC
jgi:hypothetical protein